MELQPARRTNSPGQGGALAARFTAPRTAGRIFVAAGKPVTVDLFPTEATQPLGVDVMATGGVVAQGNGAGHLVTAYLPTATGWLTLRARHADDKTAAQAVRMKATYTAPWCVDTALFPSLGGQVMGPPDLAMTRDLGVDRGLPEAGAGALEVEEPFDREGEHVEPLRAPAPLLHARLLAAHIVAHRQVLLAQLVEILGQKPRLRGQRRVLRRAGAELLRNYVTSAPEAAATDGPPRSESRVPT